MYVTDVVVHRELVIEIALVRKDVNHPGKNLGEKGSTFGHAGRAVMERAEHAELWVLAKVLLDLVRRRAAKVGVLMPACNAEGNTPVQLVLGGTGAGGEHDAFKDEALPGCAVVEQGSGAGGIEDGVGVFGVGVIGEMKLGLVDGWIGLDIAVGNGFLVVLVLFDCGPDLVDNSLGTVLVAGRLWTGGGDAHVVGHGFHAFAHDAHALHGAHHGIAGIAVGVGGGGFDRGARLLPGAELREHAHDEKA